MSAPPVQPSHALLQPMPLDRARPAEGFWGRLQSVSRSAVIPHAVEWMERLGWVANFDRAASGARYEHRGREFADSEIYKIIEAISWEHAYSGPSALDTIADDLIRRIAAAQEPDGYLHTLFGRPWQAPRYSDFTWGHELYCSGHLIQAAVAHHRAYGTRSLLDVAVRLADHVCVMFGPGGLNRVCGHAGIEVALVELFRTTGERRYLDQAALFVERRGTGTLPLIEFGRAFAQDDLPVRKADVLRGHAVRALYLAAGAVDVAVETGDRELLDALRTQWDNTVARRTYITGGMGSHHMDEAFGEDHVLPPDRSYCETCAGVASIMFSWRLLLATGDPRHADLIERTLYNIVATSLGEDGRSFFYANTLHQRHPSGDVPLNDDGVCIRGGAGLRQAWYEVSCCPPNLARTLASLGGYLATTTSDGIQIHQYASSTLDAVVAGEPFELDVTTDYPHGGVVTITVRRAPARPASITLRDPEWSQDTRLSLNGAPAEPAGMTLTRTWQPGDRLELTLDLRPRVVRPDHRVDAIRGCVAVRRGPEVLAMESIDLPPSWALEDATLLPDTVAAEHGSVVVTARHHRSGEDRTVPLIPYRSWARRGPSAMRVWIPEVRD
ncbi:beta-L-arabinofuranosidase domain-containing protein [Nonomuraea sp. NPDC049625]|uniref:glycoside hydrolase family 127 protein n=1 Tax=Nonomuraea sp. NPDC049625 TaxID=3155775 RepID=UPI003433E375